MPGVGEQLAKRDRQLALANALGARLAGMDEPAAIAEATVEELQRAFGYHLSAVIRLRPMTASKRWRHAARPLTRCGCAAGPSHAIGADRPLLARAHAGAGQRR